MFIAKNLRNAFRVTRDHIQAELPPDQTFDGKPIVVDIKREQDGWDVRLVVYINGKVVHSDTPEKSEKQEWNSLMFALAEQESFRRGKLTRMTSKSVKLIFDRS